MPINSERIGEYLIGAAGFVVFGWIVFHWRATLRRMDKRNTERLRALKYSEEKIQFSNIFTPVYLLIGLFFLFFVSFIFLIGFGADMTGAMFPGAFEPLK